MDTPLSNAKRVFRTTVKYIATKTSEILHQILIYNYVKCIEYVEWLSNWIRVGITSQTSKQYMIHISSSQHANFHKNKKTLLRSILFSIFLTLDALLLHSKLRAKYFFHKYLLQVQSGTHLQWINVK